MTFGTAETEAPRGIVELPDGSVGVSGYVAAATEDARVWKLTPTGVLDATFGAGGADGDGIVTLDFTGGDDQLRPIRVQADGKLVASGNSNNGTNDDVAVVRLLTDGTPDPTFGTAGAGGAGRARYDVGGGEAVYGIAIADDGAILAGGSSAGNYAIARLGSDTIANYAGTWAAGSNTFGACLVDVSAGTAQWNEMGAGNCQTATAAAWNPIPADTTGGIADVVTFSGAQSGVTVDLRFGLRTASAQPPGAYVAPISFTFVSP